MAIADNITSILSTLPPHVKLIAVSKLKPERDLMEAYQVGQRAFGENYVQEMVQKAQNLPQDIEWHFIGHLQTNKVKYIAPFVHLIHSVDSIKILHEINKQASKNGRNISCLLQIHIAQEDTKTGIDPEEFLNFLQSEELKALSNVSIIGVMGMSTFTDDEQVVLQEFKTLKHFFEEGKKLFPNLREISMGMSGDYLLAIQEGSTMIRIGSTIFGSRN